MKIHIIDSAMTWEEAIKNCAPDCPASLLREQTLVTVQYYSFDGTLHQGQLVLNRACVADVNAVFEQARRIRFPIASVIPISHERFLKDGRWDDVLSMRANNSSAFNYRAITGGTKLSVHSFGTALDINPVQNPYISGSLVLPEGAAYDPRTEGTFTPDHPLVQEFLSRGWTWGGAWETLRDYHHFEKNIDVI